MFKRPNKLIERTMFDHQRMDEYCRRSSRIERATSYLSDASNDYGVVCFILSFYHCEICKFV